MIHRFRAPHFWKPPKKCHDIKTYLVNKLVDPENHQFFMETSLPTPMTARVKLLIYQRVCIKTLRSNTAFEATWGLGSDTQIKNILEGHSWTMDPKAPIHSPDPYSSGYDPCP